MNSTRQMYRWQPDNDFEPNYSKLGKEMHDFAHQIFPFNRSISGDGVRQTLSAIKKILPELQIHEVPTGMQCFDWTVPDEWNVREAYIADMDGNRIVDFKDNNLHLLGYSEPIDTVITREELDKHLYSIPDRPEVIPYTTSYYNKTWGFCLAHQARQEMTDSKYKVLIDSDLKPGHLTYADLIIPGETDDEILLSTYTCHPSLANNEVSGPTLATFLGRLLQNKNNRFTYRIVFVPETIGPVIYMSKNLDHMKRKTLAGFILTCVGDDRAFSFMPSRHGNTIADHLARQTLEKYAPDYVAYNYLQDRASDERQYCSPGADLPVVSMMRTAYGRYPEYHTSLDDLSVISPEGFAKSIYLHSKTISKIEHLRVWQATNIGEPQLSRRAYRSTIGGQREPLPTEMRLISNILAMADGVIDTSTLAHLIDHPESEIDKWCEKLAEDGLLCQVY